MVRFNVRPSLERVERVRTLNAALVLQKVCGVQMGSYGNRIDVIITCVRWRRESRHMLWRRFLVTLSVL